MKKNLTYILIIFSFKLVYGQKNCNIVHDTVSNRDYYISPEKPPKYPDGNELMMAFIKNNMVIPDRAFEMTETIYLGFIVETNGALTFLKMLKPFDDEEIKKEIIRVVQQMPKWSPGSCKNKSVASLFVLPINFNLK